MGLRVGLVEPLVVVGDGQVVADPGHAPLIRRQAGDVDAARQRRFRTQSLRLLFNEKR